MSVVIEYRITGKRSVERLEPLLHQIHPALKFLPYQNCDSLANEGSTCAQRMGFVWETYCEKTYWELHNRAVVLNRLHNNAILESKSNFAYLGHLVQEHRMLETFVARNSEELLNWIERRWGSAAVPRDGDDDGDDERDWWAVKVSAGNGGRDVHIMNRQNWRYVLQGLPNEEAVLQECVPRPLLYQGRKFHFRCYALLMGDMAAYLHRHCFILTSSLPYNPLEPCTSSEQYASRLRMHVTNLSINKKFTGHPGQIPCNLPADYPDVFLRLSSLWAEIVQAARPYLRCQRSRRHFDFYGLDVVCSRPSSAHHNDDSGAVSEVHVIELNRLPGLESSALNTQAEDALYDEMMRQALRIVLAPEISMSRRTTGDAPPAEDGGTGSGDTRDWVAVNSRPGDTDDPASQGDAGEGGLVSNMLRWRCLVKSLERRVLAQHN
ncbi:hypothetical protein EON64_04380 [archaeon]|nr:MAG: hypothetical protein EON64_04380 [archaeon]